MDGDKILEELRQEYLAEKDGEKKVLYSLFSQKELKELADRLDIKFEKLERFLLENDLSEKEAVESDSGEKIRTKFGKDLKIWAVKEEGKRKTVDYRLTEHGKKVLIGEEKL